jgi:hypothetical protein
MAVSGGSLWKFGMQAGAEGCDVLVKGFVVRVECKLKVARGHTIRGVIGGCRRGVGIIRLLGSILGAEKVGEEVNLGAFRG